jgi:2-oxoglutarate ferredoxin oxidoreductase subunit alpha
LAEVASGTCAFAVYESNQGQMVEDVRLAVLGRVPVHFIGGLSIDSSGFGIAPDLNVARMSRIIEEVFAA